MKVSTSAVERIEGTVTLVSGETVQFTLGAEQYYAQWGADRRVLGSTVDLMQALAETCHEFMVEHEPI